MKRFFALCLSLSLINAPALALEVNRIELNQAEPHAYRLNLFETARLTARKAVAQILLNEMRKSDWLLRNLGEGEGPNPRNVVVGLGYTAASAGLLTLLGALGRHQWNEAHGYASEKEAIEQIKLTIADVEANLRDGIPAALEADALKHDVTEAGLRAEIVEQQALLKTAIWDAKQAPIHRVKRGVVFALVPALMLAVVADAGTVWFQIAVDPTQVDHVRADLEQFIDEADLTLRQNDRR